MELNGAPTEPEDLQSDDPPRRRGRLALWCALVAVVAAAVAVVALRDPSRTPAEDLARVRDFVASAGSGHFTGESRSESGEGADEPGSTSIDISRIEGRFVLPDQVQFVEDAGDYHTEAIILGKGAYFRSGDSKAELKDAPWVYEDLPDPAEDLDAGTPTGLEQAGAAALSTASGLFGAFGSPFDLEDLLGRLDGVRRVSPGVLEARPLARDFLPDDVVAGIEKSAAEAKAKAEKDGDDISEEDFDLSFLDQPVVIRLVHATDGRLDQMIITMEDGTGEDRSVDTNTLRFSGWGEPVQIERPAPADVDSTPGIEEDKLATAPFPILAPATPPAGFVLDGASVHEADPDEDECAGADLWYGPADDDKLDADGEFRYFRISLTPVSCPSAGDDESFGLFGKGGDTTSVRIGAWQAEVRTISYGDTTEVDMRFTAGDLRVDSSGSLPQEQMVATLATLAPLDLATQPIHRSDPPPSK